MDAPVAKPDAPKAVRETVDDVKAERPSRVAPVEIPPLPVVDKTKASDAPAAYGSYQSGLSHFRTELSEHRTSLSEYRTDLSSFRTDLSSDRTEMAMRRTGMSFQRTRLGADRTLMSVIRTSLSLITFGFTIFQVFQKLKESGALVHAAAPRNFGIALVALGILMLCIGIIYHLRFMKGLRDIRIEMIAEGRIHGQSGFPVSFTMLTAVALLIIGLVAIASMIFNVGPFMDPGAGGT